VGLPEGFLKICYFKPESLVITSNTGGQCRFSKFSSQEVKHVIIQGGVNTIGGKTFKNFDELEDVEIPESVNNIGLKAFENCRKIKSLTFPGHLDSVGMDAFRNCHNLKEINVGIPNQFYNSTDGILFHFNSKVLVRYPPAREELGGEYKIPDGTEEIDAGAFEGTITLTKIHIPASVKKISENAFSYCRNLKEISGCEGVSSIPESAFEGTDIEYENNACLKKDQSHTRDYTPLEFIDEFAFRGSGMKKVTISSSVKVIGPGAFAECNLLKSIDVDASDDAVYGSKDGVLFDGNITTLIQFPSGKEGAYTIPDNVTVISRSAFRGSKKLNSVVIPDSVFFIGTSAFKDCTNLNTVEYLGNSDPGENSTDAFEGCEALQCIKVSAGYISNSFCGKKLCSPSVSPSSASSFTPLILLLLICFAFQANLF